MRTIFENGGLWVRARMRDILGLGLEEIGLGLGDMLGESLPDFELHCLYYYSDLGLRSGLEGIKVRVRVRVRVWWCLGQGYKE